MTKEKVYFATSGGRIKIGTTVKAVEDRVAAISSHLAEPLQLIGTIDGGLPMERAVQKHLKPWRIKGEWFRDCPEIRVVIESLMLKGPDAIGYVGIMFSCERHIEPRGSIDRGFNPRALGVVAIMMWGDEAATRLSEFGEVDEATARAWLEDSTLVPRLTALAFCHMSTKWLMDDDGPDHTEAFLRYEEAHGRGLVHYRLRNHLGIPGTGAA